jgi:hypothetical protein
MDVPDYRAALAEGHLHPCFTPPHRRVPSVADSRIAPLFLHVLGRA